MHEIDPGTRAVRAALALAASLVAASWSPCAPADGRCRTPVSAESRDGHTVSFRCEGGPGPGLEGPARLLFGQRLDVNRADAATLAVLPGLGAGKAEALVRERARGPFLAPEDLERVPGIGRATRARLAPWLRFDTEARAPVDPPGPGK